MDEGYEFGPSAYFSITVICMFTIILFCFEMQRQKVLSMLDKGYYFVEIFVTVRRKQLVPVPPDNVDTSNPDYPRIINPSLVQPEMCCCSTR